MAVSRARALGLSALVALSVSAFTGCGLGSLRQDAGAGGPSNGEMKHPKETKGEGQKVRLDWEASPTVPVSSTSTGEQGASVLSGQGLSAGAMPVLEAAETEPTPGVDLPSGP